MTRNEIEEVIIGILLENPEHIAKTDLELNDFGTHPWRDVFASMRAVMSEGREVDIFTIHARMQGAESGELASMMQLHQMARAYGFKVANLPYYVSDLRKVARREQLTELCSKSLEAMASGKDADKIRSRLISRLTDESASKTKQDFNIHELTNLAVEYVEIAQEARDRGATVGVPTGIPAVDKGTGGLHKSNLIVIGARPGMGKTAVALSMSVNAARKGHKCGLISTEMSAVEVGMRLVSLVANVSATSMRDASIDPAGYSKIMMKAEELKTLPIRILDKPSCTIADIMMQARAWQLSGGIDVLFVDYIQRLSSDEKGENRTREVGKFAAGLKTIARQLQIPVVALSQINRASTQRGDKRPTMADLRDSGEIEQEADMVWLLHRPGVYEKEHDPREAEIIIEKNRHGPTALVLAEWEPSTMRWKGRENYEEEREYYTA